SRDVRGEAERAQRDPRRDEQHHDGDAALTAHRQPYRGVEDDPGAAGEREEREDEPDERRVDADRLRDAGANAGDHTVVLAAAERDGHRAHRRARVTSICPAPTCASISSGAPVEPTVVVTSCPLSLRPRTLTSPQFAWPTTRTRTSCGT